MSNTTIQALRDEIRSQVKMCDAGLVWNVTQKPFKTRGKPVKSSSIMLMGKYVVTRQELIDFLASGTDVPVREMTQEEHLNFRKSAAKKAIKEKADEIVAPNPAAAVAMEQAIYDIADAVVTGKLGEKVDVIIEQLADIRSMLVGLTHRK